MKSEKKEISGDVKMINYKRLHLDNRENPRLPSRLIGSSEIEIINYMVDEGNAIALIESIGTQGFFKGEPLLVVNDDGNEEYTVIEGNRRLSAVKLLHEPLLASFKKGALMSASNKAKHKPVEIPVIVYSNRDEIIEYLGYRHITGIKEWGPLSKAKYLLKLYERSKQDTPQEKCRELAKIIGSRADYVRKLLCGLSVYNHILENGFFGIKSIEDVSFSLITTALGYTNLQEFIGLESGEDIHPRNIKSKRIEELVIWMFKKEEGRTRLGESRNLKWLASVVESEEALKEFRGGEPLESAYFITGGARETVTRAVLEAWKLLETAYRFARRQVVLEEDDFSKLDKIIESAQAIKKVVAS